MGRLKKPKIGMMPDVCTKCKCRSICASATSNICARWRATFVKSWDETTAFIRENAEAISDHIIYRERKK